jgi:hypothetical protein
MTNWLFNRVPEFLAAIALVAMGCAFYNCHLMDIEMEARHERNKQDCKTLNVTYGKDVTAKDGFYKGVPMTAVGANEETVEVLYMQGFVAKNKRFLCGDLIVL